MNINYEKVPDIISGKDLDYLSDMFQWNCGAYKKTQNCIKQVQDENIKSIIERASNVFLENTNEILEILGGKSYEQSNF